MTMKTRRGQGAVGLIFVGLIVAAVAVVMAISGQSNTTRATAAGFLHGRLAEELAESCIAEGMANFDLHVQQKTQGSDLRQPLLNAGPLVPGPQVIGQAQFEDEPVLTKQLNAYGDTFTLGKVITRFLDFSTQDPIDGKPINKGRVEFVATVSSTERSGRTISRRVTWRHNIALRVNGTAFRLEQVPFQVLVDRSGGL